MRKSIYIFALQMQNISSTALVVPVRFFIGWHKYDMLTSVVQTVAPTTYPVSLSDVKDHLGVTDSFSDSRLQLYLQAATEVVERECSLALAPQTWLETYDCFPHWNFFTTRAPIQSITSLTYYDQTNTLQTLVQGTDYYAVFPTNQPALLTPIRIAGNFLYPTWADTFQTRPDCVALTYVAGYATPLNRVQHAIKILVTYWSDGNRGSNDLDIPNGFDRLLGLIRYGKYR